MSDLNRGFAAASRAVRQSAAALLVALATLWPAVSPAADGDAVVAVNWKSLERSDGFTQVWSTTTFPATITLGHGLYPHRSQRLHYAIDCERRTFGVTQWLLTDEAGGAGQVVWSGRSHASAFSTPWPGSAEEAIVSQACARARGADLALRID